MLLQLIACLAALGLSVQAQSVDGLWRSEGYGIVFDIHGQNLKTFEVTDATCVVGGVAQREGTGIAGREATFKSTDGDVFFIRSGGAADPASSYFRHESLCYANE